MAASMLRYLELLLLLPASMFWCFPPPHVLASTTITTHTSGDPSGMTPLEACMEFATSESYISWTLAECMDVWSAWARSVPEWLHLDYSDRRLMKEVAVEMRQRGQPCVVQPQVRADGVGSEVTRHLAAWLYAAELGCDYITPDFGYYDEEESENGPERGTLYCHPSADGEELESALEGGALVVEQNLESCELVNWLHFFRLEVPSVPEPEATFRNITGGPNDQEDLLTALEEIRELGWDGLPEDFRLRFTFHPSVASRYALALGSWDQYKRTIARDVLASMRSNFHQFPRSWYNQRPACEYNPSQLNFAIHVRMGDRRGIQGNLDLQYFERLHDFMDVVTMAVLEKGLSAPMFHVFTETKFPCPAVETGVFPEFPEWPVAIDKIPACVSAVRPDDCPEKRAGANDCNADRTGIFHVVGRPLILHVGDNVHECLSCMIQADGVLMGCSTFGQVAGLFTEGIKFFSVGCVGRITPVQYRMIPPLAIAEYGHMWVPIDGSWRNPALTATGPFNAALTKLVHNKRVHFRKEVLAGYVENQARTRGISSALGGARGNDPIGHWR